MPEYSVIGKPLPRIDAVVKATGQAQYTDDIKLPQMLYGKVERSPYPHARILHIDTSKAERLPGVKAVVTGKDTLGVKYGTLRGYRDRHLIAMDKVRFIGEAVAAVAAIDEDIAEEATDLIRVDYEELPAVFEAEEAMKEGAPEIHDGVARNIALERHWSLGDVEKGFKESDYIREDRFIFQVQAHGHLETHACLASYDSSGKLTIWATTKMPFPTRASLSLILGLPFSKIRVIKPHLGGDFGSKGSLYDLYFCAALLSKKAGRPVKIRFSKAEEFIAGIRRLPMVVDLKTGVRKNGTLVAQHSRVTANGGASFNLGAVGIYNTGLAHMLPYRLPNFKYDSYRVYTNNPVGGPQRGHGQVLPRVAIECQLEMIAEELGIDGMELRLKNALQTGDVTANKLQIISCGLSETIQKVAARAEWKKKRSEGLPGRGIGIACSGFVCGVRTAALADSGAIIKLNEDGGIVLLTGAADVGQGSDTVLAQITAEVLGITLDDITVVAGDTDATPYDAGSIGSRVTTYAGGAVIKAAQDMKNQLAEVAAGMLQCTPEDLEFRDRKVWVRWAPERSLSFPGVAKAAQVSGSKGVVIGKGSYSPTNIEWPNHNGEGNVAQSYSFATQAAEVEVDKETGKVKFLKMTVGDDIGFPLNPIMVEGQVEGSVSMGQGLVMYEELITREGMILNPSYTNYKMPSALDSPQIETIHTITNDPLGPFGGKEVGEGIIVSTPAAIANAIHDATGVWIKDLPITPDKIVKALQEKEGRQ